MNEPPAWVRLETLAWEAGMTADELRERLRREIERRGDEPQPWARPRPRRHRLRAGLAALCKRV